MATITTINQTPGIAPLKKRGMIRRTVGAVTGTIGGGIKGALVGAAKGAGVGGVGGAVLGGAPGAGVGAAAGGVGGGLLGGVKGAFKGGARGARKFAKPKVVYNKEQRMPVSVTINNAEQRRVEHQLIVNKLIQSNQPTELVTNAGFGGLGKMIGRAGRVAKVKAGRAMGKTTRRNIKSGASIAGGSIMGKAQSIGQHVGRNKTAYAAGGAGAAGIMAGKGLEKDRVRTQAYLKKQKAAGLI